MPSHVHMVVSVHAVSVCVVSIYICACVCACVCLCTCVNDCLLVNVGSTVLFVSCVVHRSFILKRALFCVVCNVFV